MTETKEKNTTEAVNAGRGGIFVLGAKVFFIVIGFVQQALLKHAIGLSEYGALARVLAPANIVNNVVVQGSIQGVSRRVAPAREHWPRELAAVLRVHVPIAFALAAGFALFADPIASFQKAPHIVLPLRVMALVALAYGIYAPFVGTLNGRTRFGRQAALDVIFATLRTAGLVGLGYFFARRGSSGALGATIGFALAAAIIAPLAATWARRRDAAPDAPSPAPEPIAARAYLFALASVALAQALTNALMQADITLVGRFLSQGALASGLDETRALTVADEWVGVYRACQLFGFLPYQLVLSVAQVLFPMVARAHADGDKERVREIVRRGMRIATIMAGAIVAIVASLSGTLLNFAYGHEVAERGAAALRILSLGQGTFALFGVASSVLVSLGRERTSAWLSGAALLLVGGACFALASGAPFGALQIERAALATSVGLVFALALVARALGKNAGTFAPVSTLARVAAAVGVIAIGGSFAPILPKLLAPVAAIVPIAVYLTLLVALREIKSDDLASIRRLVRR